MSPEISNRIAAVVIVGAIFLLWAGVAAAVMYVLLSSVAG